MQKFKQQRTDKVQLVNITTVLTVLLLFLTMTHAQRPFFAGGRPAGGLNQKDKYNHPELAAGIQITTTTIKTEDTNGLGNRFGGSNADNNINVPQRAPIGMPVVYPESNYYHLTTTQQTSYNTNNNKYYTTTKFDTDSGGSGIANRFGAADSDNEVINRRPAVLPFDARGDVDLVNQLSRLPPDQQPFWFLNYQAIEAQRNRSVLNSASASASAPVVRSTFAG